MPGGPAGALSGGPAEVSGDGVAEEHRAEPADHRVETFLKKVVDLRVGALEGDVT
jgi:hypothetical protein